MPMPNPDMIGGNRWEGVGMDDLEDGLPVDVPSLKLT